MTDSDRPSSPPYAPVRTPGMLQSNSRLVNFAQRLIDSAIVVGTLALACTVYPVRFDRSYTIAAFAAVLAFITAAEINGLYRSWRGFRLRDEALRTLLTWALVVSTLLFAAFATKSSEDFSRVAVTGWFIATPCLLITFKGMVRIALREVRRRGGNSRTVGIVGLTPVGVRLAEKFRNDRTLGLRVLGFYDDRVDARQDTPEAVESKVGDFDQLVLDSKRGELDIVYIALPLKAEERIARVARSLADSTVTVYMAADLFMFDLMHARWDSVGDLPVLSVFDSPFDGVSGWLKRLEDIVLSVLILSLIAVPMLFIALAIKLTSKGPVFFVQRRYGLGGAPIHVLKFRTMHVAEDGAKVTQARRDDPRITPLGAFLRRHSLDELPQFLNVLAGSMSVVGPRPHAVTHNEQYRSQIFGYMLRHKVKPGITGWAQVNGWRGETDTVDKMQRRIEHDLYYINNWNFFWDLKIVALTVFGSRTRKNAY